MPIIRKKKKNTYTYECGRMEVCVFGGKSQSILLKDK